jgi:photosystem II stability/assembly factor-like uncharacterized protein
MKPMIKLMVFALSLNANLFASGGNTWVPQSGGTTKELRSVYFIDANTGWAVGDSGTILKTTNGGSAWLPQTSPTTEELLSVYFIPQGGTNTGLAVGRGGTILKTTDGGSTWTAQTSPTTEDLFSVYFISQGGTNTGWAVGGVFVDIILKTTDGGSTWSAQTIGKTLGLFSVHFADANTGWAVGGLFEGAILKTTDGGSTWSAQTNIPASGLFSSVHFRDANTGWVAGCCGTILKTTNGGTTWLPQTSETENNLESVYFADANTGWAVGWSGTILKTTDGGSTWSAESSGRTEKLNSVFFVDTNTGWTVGDGGTILKTTTSNGTTTLRNFNPQGGQIVWFAENAPPIDSGFVFGTNIYGDQAKATALQLPGGTTQASVTEVKAWFGYKRSGLTNQTYRLEIYNGDPTTGPQDNAIFSQSYALANVLADDNLQTPEQATVHLLPQPVTVGPTFFVAINFGAYSQAEVASAAIMASDRLGQRVPEEWELWGNGTWHNVSDAWFGQNSNPGSGTNGWRMWIEATVSIRTAVDEAKDVTLPKSVELAQNYPNPFNPETSIRYELPFAANVLLVVFDLNGRRVASLDAGMKTAGEHLMRWDGRDSAGNRVPSGVYFYRLEATSPAGAVTILTKKMTVMK